MIKKKTRDDEAKNSLFEMKKYGKLQLNFKQTDILFKVKV